MLRSRTPFLRVGVKTLIPVLIVAVTRLNQARNALYRVTFHTGLRAQAVYPIALSWLPDRKDGNSRQGRLREVYP